MRQETSIVDSEQVFCVNAMADLDGGNFELLPYKKNVSFRYEKLNLATENGINNNGNDNDDDNDDDNDCSSITFNIWDNNFDLQKKVHISDNLNIHYKNKGKCLLFKLKFDNISGTIDKDNEKLYFRPTSLIQTGLIYDILAEFEDKVCEKLKISFIDIVNRLGMFRLNCQQEIPVNKFVYLKDLIVAFKRVDKVNYRGKLKYCIVSDIVQGEILLQK